MQTNPMRRCATVIATLLGCFLMLGLFVAQLRYVGFESGMVSVERVDADALTGYLPASSSGVVTAEYCSEVVAANDPSNPSGRTSTRLAFDDAWLFQDARSYNHELATACSVLAAVCNSESQYYDGVAGSIPYAERTLGLLGFRDVRTESYALRSTVVDELCSLLAGSSDVAAYTLASKVIVQKGGQTVTLVFVGIRGTYGAEWISNFNFLGQGLEADHRGFKAAEEEVKEAVRAYAREIGADPTRTRVLITGHSRGGAIANLLAADLNDPDDGEAALAPASGIYAYTFAAPCATRASDRHNPAFDNIFNVVNDADIVTQLPLAAWGFDRYGATVTLPSVSSAGFDSSYATMQTAYRNNTGNSPVWDEDELASLCSFGSAASDYVPSTDYLASPLGVVGAVRSLIGLDVATVMNAHYPDTYIAWMQAVDIPRPAA